MDRASALVKRGVAAGAVAWAAMVPLAAYAAGRPDASMATSLFALAIYGVGSVVCHQRPERSFFLWGRQLPVCARCTGIYVGAAVISIVTGFRSAEASRSSRSVDGFRLAEGSRSSRSMRVDAKTLMLVAVSPLAATLIFEWTTGITPDNWIRAATGILAGAAVAWVVSK